MKNIRKLQYQLAKLEDQAANQDNIIDRIERSKKQMVISQYRQGDAPPSKYELHGRYKRGQDNFKIHERYAMDK